MYDCCHIFKRVFVNSEFNFNFLTISLCVLIAVTITGVAFFLLTNKKKGEKVTPTVENKPEIKPEITLEIKPEIKPEVVTISFKERLKKGLSRSRLEVWGKVSSLFSGGLDDEKIESLEELLYGADIGTATVSELMIEVHKKAKEGNLSEEVFKNFLFGFLALLQL